MVYHIPNFLYPGVSALRTRSHGRFLTYYRRNKLTRFADCEVPKSCSAAETCCHSSAVFRSGFMPNRAASHGLTCETTVTARPLEACAATKFICALVDSVRFGS